MSRKSSVALVVAALLATSVCWSGEKGGEGKGTSGKKVRPESLVSAGSLAKRLNVKRLRVLDTRAEGDYAKGHVPGALVVDVKRWMAWINDPKTAANAEHWTKATARLGLSEDTQIVVYGTSVPSTARLWWALRYLGFRNVAMLDGGWQHWSRGKHPVSKESPKQLPSKGFVRIDASVLGTTAEVKKCIGSADVQLLDTRSIGEWERGRIPGATRLEWKALLREDGRFLPVAKLEEIFEKRGLDREKTIVPY